MRRGLALAAGPAAACGDDAGGGTAAAPGGGRPAAGVDRPGSDTDFWNSSITYVPRFGAENGLEPKTTDSQNDISTLTASCSSAITRGRSATRGRSSATPGTS